MGEILKPLIIDVYKLNQKKEREKRKSSRYSACWHFQPEYDISRSTAGSIPKQALLRMDYSSESDITVLWLSIVVNSSKRRSVEHQLPGAPIADTGGTTGVRLKAGCGSCFCDLCGSYLALHLILIIKHLVKYTVKSTGSGKSIHAVVKWYVIWFGLNMNGPHWPIDLNV